MGRKYLQDVSVVNFYGESIITGLCAETGQIMVPLKQIIDGHLGMKWQSFRDKMAEHCSIMGDHSLYHPDLHTVLSDDIMEAAGHSDDTPLSGEVMGTDNFHKMKDEVDFVCVPLTELNLLLAQINLLRIPDEERRIRVSVYQRECQRALHDYWNYGMAIADRVNPSDISSGPRPEEERPDHWTTIRIQKTSERYSKWCNEIGLSNISTEDIINYVKTSICELLDIENENWKDQDGALGFLVAFMERAASDILMMSVEAHIMPEDLTEVLDKNLLHVWENMGSLIITTSQPYNLFPGAGRGATRELVS